jgi:NitT/TauT family transport system permease protein
MADIVRGVRLLAKRLPALVILVATWHVVSSLLGDNRLPGPLLILSRTFSTALSDPLILAQTGIRVGFLAHAAITLGWTLAGLLTGIVSGLAFAAVVAQSRVTASIAYPALEYVRVVPPLLAIPFASVLLGVSSLTEVVSVSLYAFLATGGYSLAAMLNVPVSTVSLGRLLGAGRIRLTWKVLLPSVMPGLQGAVRVVVSLGLGIAIVAEFLAAPAGIGRVMQFAMSYGRVDMIVVGVVWSVLLVRLLDLAVTILWRLTSKGGSWDLLSQS